MKKDVRNITIGSITLLSALAIIGIKLYKKNKKEKEVIEERHYFDLPRKENVSLAEVNFNEEDLDFAEEEVRKSM